MKKNNISLETDFTSNGLIITLGLCTVIIFVSILLLYLSTPPQKIYAARVNGNPITNDEFHNSVDRMKSQYVQVLKTDFTTPQGKQLLENIEKNTINTLVDRQILMQSADKMGVTVDESEIDTEIDNIKQKNFNNDNKTFTNALRQNNLTLSKLRESVQKDKLVEKVKEKITDERVKITDKEKKDYFVANKAEFTKKEQVKASHILIKDEKLANDIYQQLQNGGKFEDLSKKYSIDPGSKTNGGDLGFFEKGKMVPEFEKAVWALKVGETSQPVKSKFGYHIIKKTGFQPEGTTEFKTVAKKITDEIKKKKSTEVIEKFIKEEKEKSKVEIFVKGLGPTPVPSVAASGSPASTSILPKKTGKNPASQVKVQVNATPAGAVQTTVPVTTKGDQPKIKVESGKK